MTRIDRLRVIRLYQDMDFDSSIKTVERVYFNIRYLMASEIFGDEIDIKARGYQYVHKFEPDS